MAGRLREGLPATRTGRRFLVVSFVDAIGTGLFLAGSALFFTQVLGLSAGQVGLGLTVSGVAGLLGTVPIGRLADRLGSKRILVVLQVWRGCCFVAYPFVGGMRTFLLLSFAIGIAEWSIGPIVQSVVGAGEPDSSRVRTMAALTAIRNIGFTIGAVLATLVLATGSHGLYSGLVFADAGSFFVAAWLVARLAIPLTTRPRRSRADRGGTQAPGLRYLALTVLNGVLYLHTILLSVGVPLWVATRTSAPRAVVGVVVVVNTVLAIALQVPLGQRVAGVRDAAGRQRWAGWSLAACCLLAAPSGALGPVPAAALVLLAAVALTLGEIWQSVGAWGLSFYLAPAENRGYYLSVYNLGLTGATVVGPALVTFAVIQAGVIGWLGLAAAFTAAGFAVSVVARDGGTLPATLDAPAVSTVGSDT